MNVGPAAIRSVDPGGNMAGPLLAQWIGGGPDSMLGNLFLAFVAAVAFATIVAVVAGLVLAAASAMAHDLYVGVIREGHVTPQEQVRAARVATVLVGALAITIASPPRARTSRTWWRWRSRSRRPRISPASC